MELNEQKINVHERRAKSLLEKLHGYFDDANLVSEGGEDQLVPMFKFRSFLIIAEIYEYVRLFFANRESLLSEYFSERTLKQCLQDVADVEELQNKLADFYQNLKDVESAILWNTDLAGMAGLEGLDAMPGLYEYRDLRQGGIGSLCCDNNNIATPSALNSVLWKNKFGNAKSERYDTVFRKAKETLDEKSENGYSSDYYDRAVYNRARKNLSLGNRRVEEVKNWEIHSPKKRDANKFDFLTFIVSMQQKAETATADDIQLELRTSLELLRNAFMTEAEDIYYIRTGDFEGLNKVYDKNIVHKYYSILPFTEYNKAKEEYLLQFHEELEISISEWRINKGYIGRKLSPEEYEEFLYERLNGKEEDDDDKGVIRNMQSYMELWKLRMHSGGLDEAVTPENFARMFYRRKGVDRYFIELQWELEELTSLIEKNRQKPAEEEIKAVQTPEQKAVADFVDKIIILANEVYKKWNNERVTPAVHEPEVLIVIQKDELIKHMQDKQKADFEELSELCYPENSKSKQTFCQYVVKLQKEGYFGKLPDNLLAEQLASVVGLASGTVANYLSKFK